MKTILFVLALFLAVSSWAICQERIAYGSSDYVENCEVGKYGIGSTYKVSCGSLNGCRNCGSVSVIMGNRYDGYNVVSCTASGTVDQFCNNKGITYNFVGCTTQAEADSLKCILDPAASGCVNQDSVACFERGGSWQNGVCIETSYHCQNAGGSGPVGGSAPVAIIYKCENDVCEEQQRLAGTCSDWGYCNGASNCDITDSTGKVPCVRSGNGTSTNGKCYYSCGNGKKYTCNSKYSTWGGGENGIYVGSCPDYPECATDINNDTTSRDNPYNDSGSSDSVIVRDTSSWSDSGSSSSQINYYPILDSILDTLTLMLRNSRSQTFSQQAIHDLLSQQSNTLDDIARYDRNGFTLVGEVSKDLDSSRLLLKDIKDLISDTLNVRVSGVSAAPDTIPVYNDSSWFQKIYNWVSGALTSSNDSSYAANDCKALYQASNKCISDGGSPLDCRLEWQQKCGNDISPVETMVDGSLTLLSRIFDYMSNDPGEPDTTYSVDSSAVERVKDLLSRFDSVPDFDLDSLRAALQSKIDSAQNKRDSVQMKPDSLFMDTSSIRKKFQGSGIFLPGGTNNTCYVCRAELGTFGGLSDTSLAINIDFGDFGGYDWCELGRTVIRIATLVVVISLTLGSFAAAFGWNRSTGEG